MYDVDRSVEDAPVSTATSRKGVQFRIKRKEVAPCRSKRPQPRVGSPPICHNCLTHVNPELGLITHPLLESRCFCSVGCLHAVVKEVFVDCHRCSKVVAHDLAVGEEHAFCSAVCLDAHAEELSFENHEEEAHFSSCEEETPSDEGGCEADAEELLAALREATYRGTP